MENVRTIIPKGTTMASDNPILKTLGFSATDKVVVVHADDVGMCQATLPAVSDLFDAGLVSSGAAMVPCPWFSAAAKLIADRGGLDIGVHTTLTSEWESYRWGPISTRDSESGLLAEDRCFPRTTEEVWARARPEAVERELRAQIERASGAGLDITHIDTHMGAVIPRFVDIYVDLAIEYRVPAMFLDPDTSGFTGRAEVPEPIRSVLTEQLRKIRDHDMPVFDRITSLSLDEPDDRIEQAKRRFDELPAGLSLFILHPAQDTPELRAIAPDWPSRVADYQAFSSDELIRHVRESGVRVIGYRELRDAIR